MVSGQWSAHHLLFGYYPAPLNISYYTVANLSPTKILATYIASVNFAILSITHL